MTTINNDWITLSVLRNGVQVQRKFAGLDTKISTDNEVEKCLVKYWERELYPNGEVIKTEEKYYKLEDLSAQDVGETQQMLPLPVLSGFVNNLGYPGIINPARETLENVLILPVNVENGYPLRRDTREITDKKI
jgi:hypothetical protein